METKQFQLTPEEQDQLNRIATSINFQSVQLAKAELQIEDMRSGVRSLYQAQHQFWDKIVIAHEIDPKQIIPNIDINQEGMVTVKIRPSEPVKPSEPSNGDSKDPAQPSPYSS